MNLGQNTIGNEWASQLITDWLDAEFQPSVHALRRHGWSSLVVADYLNWMEAEWLAEAIVTSTSAPVCGVGVEYKAHPETVVLTPERDAIMQFNFANSWRYAILTSLDAEFLYYKDEANRFYLLCGPSNFVSLAYRCSWETARKMYFDYWVDLELRSEDEKRFLTGVWEKYSSFQNPV